MNTSPPAGVRPPPPPRTGQAGRLLHVERAEMVGLAYVDDAGQSHTTIALKIGARWYLAPNGEAWAAALKPLKPESWLAQALEKKANPPPKPEPLDLLK